MFSLQNQVQGLMQETADEAGYVMRSLLFVELKYLVYVLCFML